MLVRFVAGKWLQVGLFGVGLMVERKGLDRVTDDGGRKWRKYMSRDPCGLYRQGGTFCRNAG